MLLVKFSLLFGLAVIVKGHGPRINLAALANGALCTSDSELSAATCEKALDSRENAAGSEWITERDADTAHINITFAVPGTVDEIRILQRCNSFDRTEGVTVLYSDGSTQALSLACTGTGETGLDCDGITWQSFPVSSVVTSYLTLTILQVCDPGSFYGFREIVVMGRQITQSDTTNLAPKYIGGTCESSSDWTEDFTCQNAIDEVIGPNENQAWITAEGDAVGSWLKISLPSLSEITKVRIKSRCHIAAQMKTVNIDFGGGVSQTLSLNCIDCDDQIWNEFDVANIVTSDVNITGTEGCDPNPVHGGFQEVELHGRAESPDEACPFNFTEIGCLSSCYMFIYEQQQMATFVDAQAACASFYPQAHLVEINTAEEQAQIAQRVQQIQNDGANCAFYFTNGVRVSGSWIWEASGDDVVYTDWAPGHPITDPPEANYIRLSQTANWQWENEDGVAQRCFVCEKEI